MNENLALLAAEALKTHEAKEARAILRDKVITWFMVGLVGVFIGSGVAQADPMARTESGGVVVTIYTEPCKLDAVTNLPQRATWVENGKTTEGCAGIHPAGAVMFYFSDKTVVIHPTRAFVPVTGV